ncbi:hypothetical protein COU79_03870 [Candidatus Peregrinibacteria bacterium CG10_big_fil_rev_8_21_14_0_10_54_7]|nr:MAG: hypothetical protein COU79_03870 [Candidatus Peregrinibacteria bacterium CG10_big_fil_rev_8_21_14_0_10_54_7]
MTGSNKKQIPERKERHRDTHPVQQQTPFPSRDLRKNPTLRGDDAAPAPQKTRSTPCKNPIV